MVQQKTGDIVRIYQKPITMEDFEGEARCIKYVRELSDGYVQHMVEFVGHKEEGTFLRTFHSKRDFVRES